MCSSDLLIYWRLTPLSQCYGRSQRQIYLEDTGSSLKIGPLAYDPPGTDPVVRIARAPGKVPAFSREYPSTYGFRYAVWVKGDAKVYVKDPEGQISIPVFITPP